MQYCTLLTSENFSMKTIVSALVLTGLVGAPGVVMAEEPASPHTLSANVSLTSNYVFRGISQTQNGPAIQGGVDYSHASGFYLGTWASNVSWVSTVAGTPPVPFKDNNSMEIDFYGGFKGKVADDFGYDLGVITYYYPGDQVSGSNDPDTTELYLGASWKFLSMKYSYTVSDQFVGWGTSADSTAKTDGSYYIEGAFNYDLGSGWGVLAHVGYQDVKDNDPATYTDWKLAVSKDVGFGVFALAYTGTDADTATYTWTTSTLGDNTKKVADDHWFLSFSKSF
jgi:uncharacterized protein (TIGR02001 family)